MLEPLSETTDDQLKLVEYGSDEYHQAAQLRYHLFYQEHNIPLESIFDPQEKQDLHLAITANAGNRVLAYGRLGQNSLDEFQIYQMVVVPECQGQGLGMRILQALSEMAIERGASHLVLNARVTRVKFYQKFDFEPVGEVFASSMTGVLHIKMRREMV
ncbi:GNAT family N-acetyltransferase [Fischerella thermalis CCMEE 5201]|nr:GNAT family N-acetyltransferase [Fischerella thermalis CCMEE 5201]